MEQTCAEPLPPPPAGRPASLKLRQAVDADVRMLRRLVNASFAEHKQRGVNFTGVYQDEAETRNRMQGRAVWLAYHGRRPAGTVSLELLVSPEGVSYLDISQFAVHPACKGRGLGSLLLEFAEQQARLRGAAETRLSTAAGIDHLLRFYLRRGYHPVGRTRRPGKNYDSLILAKRL